MEGVILSKEKEKQKLKQQKYTLKVIGIRKLFPSIKKKKYKKKYKRLNAYGEICHDSQVSIKNWFVNV